MKSLLLKNSIFAWLVSTVLLWSISNIPEFRLTDERRFINDLSKDIVSGMDYNGFGDESFSIRYGMNIADILSSSGIVSQAFKNPIETIAVNDQITAMRGGTYAYDLLRIEYRNREGQTPQTILISGEDAYDMSYSQINNLLVHNRFEGGHRDISVIFWHEQLALNSNTEIQCVLSDGFYLRIDNDPNTPELTIIGEQPTIQIFGPSIERRTYFHVDKVTQSVAISPGEQPENLEYLASMQYLAEECLLQYYSQYEGFVQTELTESVK